MSTVTDTEFADALVRRIVSHLSLDLTGADAIDVDASFFDTGGFRFAGVDLDSMSFVEMLVTLEEEAGVALLDAPDVAAFDSISLLAGYVVEHGDADRVAAFRKEWAA